MPNTSPDNIYYPDTSAAHNQPAYMGTHASSVQAALDKRQRGSYVWSNATGRSNQTGMAEGAEGYQLDTKTEYKYENGAWRLATPYAEFNSASKTIAAAGNNALGAMSIDTSQSTSTTFVSGSGFNFITLNDPGIYSISCYIVASSGLSTGSYGLMTKTANSTVFADQLSRSTFANDNVTMLSRPFFRSTVSGQPIYFWAAIPTTESRTFTATVSVGRLG